MIFYFLENKCFANNNGANNNDIMAHLTKYYFR